MKWNARKTLVCAFGASLALHFFVLPLLHMGPPDPGRPETISTYTLEHRPIPTPKPTPRPTPSHTPKPRAAAQPHARIPRISVKPPARKGPSTGKYPVIAGPNAQPNTGSNPNENFPPGPQSSGPPATSEPLPTPAPTPQATKPPCAHPNVAPATVQVAEPETPALAQAQGITGEVSVVVSLNEQSRLTAARIAKSPSTLLNAAALRAARDTTYRTEVRDCKPIAADYLFVIEFMSE
jgi:TonB family protein